tara:strand:- start:214 stop:324 length:111 start_codon:yes stop_codon:yes gene_type:complete
MLAISLNTSSENKEKLNPTFKNIPSIALRNIVTVGG